jgi:hypothetical protein
MGRRRVTSARAGALSLLAGALLLGCASAGPYGYAQTYSALDAEESAAAGAADYDPVMIARKPRAWIGKRVSTFGVVQSVNALPDGSTEVLLGIRTLQARNLCESDDESTCRVTVSDSEFGTVHARLQPRKEEARITPGALLRVIGPIDTKPHPETGNSVIAAQYYRHWPLKQFVTTSARSYMLR